MAALTTAQTAKMMIGRDNAWPYRLYTPQCDKSEPTADKAAAGIVASLRLASSLFDAELRTNLGRVEQKIRSLALLKLSGILN